MKEVVPASFVFVGRFCFISHMVQMKVDLGSFVLSYAAALYIPHGSDESIVEYQNNRSDASFISHMVQMKGDNLAKSIKDALNFISHMVQMKEDWK